MEKIEFIFDSASKLLEASQNNEKSINILIKKSNKEIDLLNSSIIDLNDMQYNIDDTIRCSLNKNSVEISNKIINKLTKDFSEANEYAREASEIYKNSVKWSVFKIFLFTIVLFCMLSGSIFFYYKTYLPKEIENMEFEKIILTSELSELESNINKLERLGAKTKITHCDNRPCFPIDDSVGYYENKNKTEKYYIIKGY